MGSQLFTIGIIVVVAAVAIGIFANTFRRKGADDAQFAALDELSPPRFHRDPRLSPDPDYAAAPQAQLWSRLTTGDNGPLTVADRLDMVSRLEKVGEKWCVDALRAAEIDEADSEVKAAARNALLRLVAAPQN